MRAEDTIVAVATPPGRGGIGVVRLSGALAREIAARLIDGTEPLQPRQARLSRLVVDRREPIDRAIVTFFPGPASYTGEDVVEVSAHGSPVLLEEVVTAALRAGARLAERGEFTLRAFLNGRMDLVQAEAVGDLIAARTRLQARAAFDQLDGTLTMRIAEIDGMLLELVLRLEASLDFPEEGYAFIESGEASRGIEEIAARVEALAAEGRRGRLLREGIRAIIVGRPNVGKSSVFNRLAGAERAIVTEVPGTTRDLITEAVDLNGIPVTLVDTAGLRDAPSDQAESEGVRRARQSLESADLLVVVIDGSEPLHREDAALLEGTALLRRVIVINKADLAAAWECLPEVDRAAAFRVSALSGEGFEALRSALGPAAGAASDGETIGVTNIRHVHLLERALDALGRAARAAQARAYEELVLADLHEARGALEEVTGRRSSDDLLEEIFGRFCIGK